MRVNEFANSITFCLHTAKRTNVRHDSLGIASSAYLRHNRIAGEATAIQTRKAQATP